MSMQPNTQTPKVGRVVQGAVPPKNLGQFDLILINAAGSPVTTVVKQAAQADSVATTVAGLVTDFNALLAKLRSAGILS